MSVDSDGPLPLIKISLVKRQHWRVKNIRNIVWSVLNFSRESTEDISIWERVYWYGVEVGRCAQTIYGYTVDKNIGFATVRADIPDGAELTVGCNDSPAIVVNKVFC